MEVKTKETSVDQTNPAPTIKGEYVSPEILAAQSGEKVEFGKNLVEVEEG